MDKWNSFHTVKLSQIEPLGWLKNFLIAEKKGMPGNLHKIGYPFNTGCWQQKSLTAGGYSAW